MKVEVLITTQIFMNSSITEDGYVDGENPSWSKKGRHFFKVEVDDSIFWFGSNDEVIEKLQTAVSKESNELERFEVLSYEVLWHGITEIEEVIS